MMGSSRSSDQINPSGDTTAYSLPWVALPHGAHRLEPSRRLARGVLVPERGEALHTDLLAAVALPHHIVLQGAADRELADRRPFPADPVAAFRHTHPVGVYLDQFRLLLSGRDPVGTAPVVHAKAVLVGKYGDPVAAVALPGAVQQQGHLLGLGVVQPQPGATVPGVDQVLVQERLQSAANLDGSAKFGGAHETDHRRNLSGCQPVPRWLASSRSRLS